MDSLDVETTDSLDVETTDSLDVEIIRELEINARCSSTELARKLHSSPPTIRRRIRKLVKQETLSFRVVVDPTKIGYRSIAMIGLTVSNDRIKSVMKILFDKPEVIWAANTTGRFDIIFVGQFHNTSELSRFLTTEIPTLGRVTRSETFVCLETFMRMQFSNSIIDRG